MDQFDHQGFTAYGRSLMNGTVGMTTYGMQELTRTQGMTPYGVELTTGLSSFGGNSLLQQQHVFDKQQQDFRNNSFVVIEERRRALEVEPFKYEIPKYEPFNPTLNRRPPSGHTFWHP
jgi:hypothetical protein